jgi:hypothetical protein
MSCIFIHSVSILKYYDCKLNIVPRLIKKKGTVPFDKLSVLGVRKVTKVFKWVRLSQIWIILLLLKHFVN